MPVIAGLHLLRQCMLTEPMLAFGNANLQFTSLSEDRESLDSGVYKIARPVSLGF